MVGCPKIVLPKNMLKHHPLTGREVIVGVQVLRNLDASSPIELSHSAVANKSSERGAEAAHETLDRRLTLVTSNLQLAQAVTRVQGFNATTKLSAYCFIDFEVITVRHSNALKLYARTCCR